MNDDTIKSFTSTFEKEIYEGLTGFPKAISSKWFYDKAGDKLFQDIMAMSEYYLTNCEYDILKAYKEEIAKNFSQQDGFNLIELGAGDGKKTKVLLKHFIEKDIKFNYLPIDISQNALDSLKEKLSEELPEVVVKPKQGSYFEVLEDISDYNELKKVILVLGSNIGNLLHPQAIDFLQKLKNVMSEDDMLFMGFDQKKHPQTIYDAYNDKAGITEAFNKNVLHRINKEMDANFDPDSFLHWEVYDPETGTAKSYLVSKVEQDVSINALSLNVHFDQWESIHTEISQKYDDATLEWLAKESGLKIHAEFTDAKGYYKNYIFKTT